MLILVGVVSINLVLVLSVRLLSMCSFKGPFNKYLVYFTFIKSVAINSSVQFSSVHLFIPHVYKRKHTFNNIQNKITISMVTNI